MTEEEKQANKEKWEKRGEDMKEKGEKMKSLGCMLTILLTIPLGLTIFFGVPGLIISAGIVVIYLIGRKKQKGD